jgi:hypothetical protein
MVHPQRRERGHGRAWPLQRPGFQERAMSRNERDFLLGFQKAAILAQRVLSSPPSYTSAADYLESVAHLHGSSDDLVSRGLAVGCLSAVGKK